MADELSQLTGIVSGLSGRLSTVESTYSYINQQLLQRPDTDDFSAFQVVWNSQIQSLSDSVTRLQNQVAVLQNLTINQSLNFALHTGRTLSGLSGTHGGSIGLFGLTGA